MIKTFITAALESALNRYIKLDPEIYARIKQLPGKILLLSVPDWRLQIYLMPTPQGIRLMNHCEGEVATTISGKLFNLLMLPKMKGHDAKVFSQVTIEGDVEFGQKFRELLQQVHIDWEEPLSKFLGDSIAHQIGNGIRELMHWRQHTTEHFREDLTDYLQHGVDLLPARIEVETFFNGVSELRHDVERLEIRLQHLEEAQSP